MLAQNFKSAAELRITQMQHKALMKTLVLLETGKLTHHKVTGIESGNPDKFTGHFNMMFWNMKMNCGTVCCIGGTAELVGKTSFNKGPNPSNLEDLFCPYDINDWDLITTAHAAQALRNYLTIGNAQWKKVMKHEPA